MDYDKLSVASGVLRDVTRFLVSNPPDAETLADVKRVSRMLNEFAADMVLELSREERIRLVDVLQ